MKDTRRVNAVEATAKFKLQPRGREGEESDCILADRSSSRVLNGWSRSATIWETNEETTPATYQQGTSRLRGVAGEEMGRYEWNGEISKKENAQDLTSWWM